MVSVALATYNSEKYIIQQLESIVNQTIKVDEVIIQDDFSTDNTIKIITEFIKLNKITNWRIERNNINKGYIWTFKEAIRKCKGDIIILCDHDDIWLKNKNEIIINEFKKNKNILALATSFIQIDEFGNEIKTRNLFGHANNNLIRHHIYKNKLNKMNFKDVAIFNISPGCTCAFSSSIKMQLLEYDYKLPHDLQIVNIAALKNGLYYLDIVTTKYRIYSNNTIGLGHQSIYDKRLELARNGLKEKEEIKKILENIDCNNVEAQKLINKIIREFRLREKLMENKNILKYGFLALFNSLGLNKLYESVLMDIATIIIKKDRK